MKINKKAVIIILLFICLLTLSSKIKDSYMEKNTTIKVGLYSYEPYYYVDKKNNITGYYHDFLELLCKNTNIEYEYINMSLVGAKSLDDCIKMFENGEVDVISIPAGNNSLKNYNNIFKYSSGVVHIIGNENSKDIINKFDKIIDVKYSSYYDNDFTNIYNKYFRKEIIIINLIIILISFLFILFVIYKSIYPLIKKRIMITKIRKNKEKNNYILYYQPIVNPKNNMVVGFESLLRLKDKNNKILSPALFMKDIEESNMICEMTLWVLDRAINDYKIISNYECCKDNEFYVSINLSFKELENEYFVDKLIQIAKDNNIKKGSVYLEIVENVSIEDLNKIKSNIEVLKDKGFKIAIDDFGVEYSNLNILERVAFDAIKLDKYFTDKILKSRINSEVIKFLTNVAIITNKNLIIEGVEEKYQVDEIKELPYNNLFIQGYFYSKPLLIEELKNFTIEAE